MRNRPFVLPLMCSSFLVFGCKKLSPTQTLWSAQSQSSDGQWVALAHTENTDGPGINAQYTIVEMRQNISGGKPVQILVFDEGGAPVRNLKMNWIASSRLDVTYSGDPEVLFQAVKAFGKDVTVEHLSN